MEGKELTFALLILLAPHMSLSVALIIYGAIVAVAVLCSDAFRNAKDRLWDHLTGGG